MDKNVKKPKKCIKVEEAKELQKVWCDTRAPEINECMGFEDTREFHWSVKELMKYLKYVKQQSKKQGIKDPGIRVYFGSYPKSKCPDSKGYSTVFLAPTGSKPRASGKDFDNEPNNYSIEPYNWGNSGNPPKVY